MEVEAQESEYYEHSGSARPNSSDSNSDDDDTQEGAYGINSAQGPYGFQHTYTPSFRYDGPFPRHIKAQNEVDDEYGSPPEEMAAEVDSEVEDPGPFRYNKRVFITALPCLLLTLVMTGETLLAMVTIGGLIIVLMTHMGEDISKRCVVVFVLLFIPSHILVVGTILPLLWLSLYNLLLVAFVNVFFILTGGWTIIQFEAFRKEETLICAIIEQLLFSVYPMVCSALVTWVLSTVVSTPLIPFIFTLVWFVCLQLYLLPAVSSFKQTETEDDDLNVLQQPIVVAIIAAFLVAPPALHTLLGLTGISSLGLFSLPSLALLLMLVCLGTFLSTLLSLRQLCEYMGWSHLVTVKVRWGSGVGVLVMSYPVMHQLSLHSHFLLSLPVAVAGFTALALTLNLKRAKAMSLMLVGGLMLLMCLWLSHLPWGLTYYLLGVVPMTSFYLLVAANFTLCVLSIYASWHNSKEVFGLLLLLQSAGMTVCEVGLYQRDLYPLPTLQITGLVAAYTLHRLYLADKLTRNTAALTSAIQLTKTGVTALGYLLREDLMGEGDKAAVVEITAVDFCTLLVFVSGVVWIFVYETKEEVTLWEAGRHLSLLMLSLGVSAQSFLSPVCQLLLQDQPSLADLVGLWFVVSGVLVGLYSLQHSRASTVLEELMKVALVLAGVGALVSVMQPQFALSLFALYQWSEVLSLLLLSALLATAVEVSFTRILPIAVCLGVSPAIHITLLLYGEEATVLHFVLLVAVTCTLLAFLVIIVKIQEVSDAAEKFFKIGAAVTASLVVAVLVVDFVNLERRHSVWGYPGWRVALGALALMALALKTLALRLGPQLLPLTKKEDHGVPLVPIIGNVATVATFFLAFTQGPEDGLLHDLWCSASALFLILLQRDALLLTSLSPSNRATPTVMAAVGTLALAAVTQSGLWGLEGGWVAVKGVVEVLVVLASLPPYVVLAGILWSGEVWSEKAVVFLLPMNAVLFLLGSSFTAYALGVAGLVSCVGMMFAKLPLLPYNDQLMHK